MKERKVFKKLMIILTVLLIVNIFLISTIKSFEESRHDLVTRLGEKIRGGELSISEYVMLCEKTIGIYISAARSGDFKTTYYLMTPEYRSYVTYDEYLEIEGAKDFDTVYIERIDPITTKLYEANLVFSGDVSQKYLILLEENGYSIILDKFLMRKELNKEISKKKVTYVLNNYEVYTDRCVFNCTITNNRKEDVLISSAGMCNIQGILLEKDLEYVIAPGETKEISIPINSTVFVPILFEITRETDEKYMYYKFEL